MLIILQRSLEERTQTVEKTELKVYGIERTINSTVDLPTTWQSYFMKDGYDVIILAIRRLRPFISF